MKLGVTLPATAGRQSKRSGLGKSRVLRALSTAARISVSRILGDKGTQQKLFAQVVRTLMEKGLILKKGTIVDSTIVSAPSSTKNQKKERDPDAHSVKRGKAWHFGYKAHVDIDKDSSLAYTVEVTGANTHDVTMTPKLLTGDEDAVYGDNGYLGAEKRKDAISRNTAGKKVKYKINRRPSQRKTGLPDPKRRSSAGNMRSHPSEQKSNISLR